MQLQTHFELTINNEKEIRKIESRCRVKVWSTAT